MYLDDYKRWVGMELEDSALSFATRYYESNAGPYVRNKDGVIGSMLIWEMEVYFMFTY